MNELELERLVIRLIGDAGNYSGILSDAITDSVAAANKIDSLAKESAAQAHLLAETTKHIGEASKQALGEYLIGLDALDAALAEGSISAAEYVDGNQRIDKALEDVAKAEIAASKALEQDNNLRREAAALVASLTTAEDRHGTTVTKLDTLLGKGMITQKQYNQAMLQSSQTLPEVQNAMNAAARAEEEMNQARQRGGQLIQQHLSTQERYAQTTGELSTLLRQGHVDQETYNRAMLNASHTLPEVQKAMEAEARAVADAKSIKEASIPSIVRYKERVDELERYLDEGRITQEEFNQALSQAANSYRSASDGIKQVGQEVTMLGAKITMVGAAITGIFGLTTRAALMSAGQFEQTTIAFETMIGSVSETKSTLADLTTFAAKTPFEMPEIEAAARGLIQFGERGDELMETLHMLGNAASGSSTPFGFLALVFNQVRGVGKLLTQDFRQLSTRGIISLQDFVTAGIAPTTAAAQEMLSKGEISFETFKQVIESMSKEGGRFFNLMERQSESLLGKWSTLSDAINIIKRQIGEEMAPVVKVLTQHTLNATEAFGNMSPAMKKVVATILLSGTGMGAVITTVGGLVAAVGTGITAYGSLATATSIATVNQNLYNYAALAGKVAVGGLAVAGIGLLIYKLREASDSLKNFNHIMDESARLSRLISNNIESDFQRAVREAEKLGGVKGTEILASKLTDASARVKQLKLEVIDAEIAQGKLNTIWNQFVASEELAKVNAHLEKTKAELTGTESGAKSARAALLAGKDEAGKNAFLAKELEGAKKNQAEIEKTIQETMQFYETRGGMTKEEAKLLSDDDYQATMDKLNGAKEQIKALKTEAITATLAIIEARKASAENLTGDAKSGFLSKELEEVKKQLEGHNEVLATTKKELDAVDTRYNRFVDSIGGSAMTKAKQDFEEATEEAKLLTDEVGRLESAIGDLAVVENDGIADMLVSANAVIAGINEEIAKLKIQSADEILLQMRVKAEGSDNTELLETIKLLEEAIKGKKQLELDLEVKGFIANSEKALEAMKYLTEEERLLAMVAKGADEALVNKAIALSKEAEATKKSFEINKSLEDMNKSLRAQYETFGMNAEQVEAYNAKLAGLNETQQRMAAGLSKWKKSLDLRDDIAKMTKELERQAATAGMTAAEITRYDLAQRGATMGQLAGVEAAQRAAKAADELANKMEKGKSVLEQYRTPIEKLQKEIADLVNLKDVGAIDQKTFDRAIAAAEKELKGLDEKSKFQLEFNYSGLAESGSYEDLKQIEEQIARVQRMKLNPEGTTAEDLAGIKDLKDQVADAKSAEPKGFDKDAFKQQMADKLNNAPIAEGMSIADKIRKQLDEQLNNSPPKGFDKDAFKQQMADNLNNAPVAEGLSIADKIRKQLDEQLNNTAPLAFSDSFKKQVEDSLKQGMPKGPQPELDKLFDQDFSKVAGNAIEPLSEFEQAAAKFTQGIDKLDRELNPDKFLQDSPAIGENEPAKVEIDLDKPFKFKDNGKLEKLMEQMVAATKENKLIVKSSGLN